MVRKWVYRRDSWRWRGWWEPLSSCTWIRKSLFRWPVVTTKKYVGVFVATVALCTLIKNRYCESTSPAWLGQTFPSLKGFVSATWGSEMKIRYKTRKGMFFPRPPKNLCNFLDTRHSTLDPRQKPTLKSHTPSSRRVSESFSFTFYF